MSDDARPPADPTATDAGAPRPDAEDAQHSQGATTDAERTGIIDLRSTQSLPTTPPAPNAPGATDTSFPDGSGTSARADDDGGWFDVFAGEHPGEGAGVPARADAEWGSDRADALAEEAHRAAHLPPSYGPPAADAPQAAGGAPQPAPAAPAGNTATPTDEPTTTPSAGSPSEQAVPAVAAMAPPTGDPHPQHVVPPAPVPAAAATDGGSVPPPLAPPAPAVAPRRRRGPLVLGVVALCLLSAVVGGVAGQLAQGRVAVGGSALPTPGPGSTARPAGSISSIAANALPSVVTIKVKGDGGQEATGSGFVVDGRGHVLTNNHVVAPGADGGDFEVVLSNGDTEKATIVGRDVSYDLAVLKIERTDLTPLTLGESDQVVVGDPVIAVGAPLGLDQTVTSGIVSALNRPVTPGEGNETSYINAIQTDAAINPGNSGGPLLDMQGRVIGVNSAIARVPGTTSSSGGNIGLGFAIPSDQARRTADQLIATGKATHPVIGVLLDRTYSGEGAAVGDGADAVTSGGPAAKAGVKAGDVIVGFEGKPVRTPDQLVVSIRARAVGDTVTLRVERDGKEIDLRMTLEADPKG